MAGTLVNCAAIIIGTLFGLVFKKGVSEKLSDTMTTGIALCVLFIGIDGAVGASDSGSNVLVLIVSIALGGLIGHLLDLNGRINRLGEWVQNRFRNKVSNSPIAEAFVTATLLYCVGAMAIVGSIQSGIEGNHTTLFTKSLLDGIMAVVFASQLGFGVMLSAVPILIYQGGITLASGFIAPFMSDIVIAEMSGIGYVLIMGIGFNLMGVTKLKLMNYVPGIVIAAILALTIENIPAAFSFLYA